VAGARLHHQPGLRVHASEEIKGKTLEELRHWGKEEVLDLLGIPLGPVRIKCALLPLKALKAAAWGITTWPHEEEVEE